MYSYLQRTGLRILAGSVTTLLLGALSFITGAWAQTSPDFATLYAFQLVPSGPNSTLLLGQEGKLYGTALRGGTYDRGVVYRMDPTTGANIVLHAFNPATDGGSPAAGVIQDSAGNLYGTTAPSGGSAEGFNITLLSGANTGGTIYRLAPDGTFIVLHRFNADTDSSPVAGVIQDSAGNLYGTTAPSKDSFGGPTGAGMVYRLAPDGTFTVLHVFNYATDGEFPAGVIQDSAGNLYGVTSEGGPTGAGTIYRLAPDGTFIVLHAFNRSIDGGFPYAGVIQDSAGNLYGTTSAGGPTWGGTVYRLAPDGTFTVLHAFNYFNDGQAPQTGVIQDSAGNLYGTTWNGGPNGGGTIYRLAPDGAFTVLHAFNYETDGVNPTAGVIQDSAGNLYGTTPYGGPSGNGTVYRLDPATPQFAVIQAFMPLPFSPTGVTPGSTGNLYGTTSPIELNNDNIIFSLTPDGTFTVLHVFNSLTDGSSPHAGVIQDSAGNLYGTTAQGGPTWGGAVYRLAADGTFTVLHAFDYSLDGDFPSAGVIQDSAGNLYGTTTQGGPARSGTVYRLAPDGSSFTVLHAFDSGSGGGLPYAGLIQDSAGNLYGTTAQGGITGAGTVYRLAPDGSSFTVLHTFDSSSDGGFPYAGVIQDSAGNLYGTTTQGGPTGAGTVYRLTPDGTFTVLHAFNMETDGMPYTGVTLGRDGNLYGTAVTTGAIQLYDGGLSFVGSLLYRLASDGSHFTILRAFDFATDGGFVPAGLTQDSAGNLYGVTNEGGPGGGGTIFRLGGTGADDDRTPPTITYQGRTPPANANGWNTSAVTVTWTCSDSDSGVIEETVSQTVTGDGVSQSVTGTCTDRAGNTSSNTQSGIAIDTTLPTFGACSNQAFAYGSGTQPVNITASDSLSGLDSAGSTLTGAVDTNTVGPVSVTYTAQDQAGNNSTQACTYEVISINQDKQAVLAELQALSPTLQKPAADKVENAIDHLTKSLNPNFWTDNLHLTQAGKQVFNETKGAVHDLQSITPPLAVTTNAIDSLVNDVRSLAVVAIGESTNKPADIQKAQQELVKGDAERANGRYEKAIDHYKKAWELAT
ncbi:MAG: choice-of-anchor tandem repeat GloVer-containing protein [Candidatus Competibacteraceae bacterium]